MSVDKSEIVKGYEYEKGKYAIIEPDDLKRLRIPGKDTLEIAQFSSAERGASIAVCQAVLRCAQEGPASDGLRDCAPGDGRY